ncbi:ATP-binding cassette domain-containing protein [Spiroplasma cantharicola]|uniref:ABC transporter ATP-binding protein n=1 Tax=Spiroplasma cantharicola TaxID=362837 RepID=A0A0M4JIK2_9MOLU|nr:ATP-binding cassette domain-containing protein [Spiroplasma cantharicola]ALD66453.1 ABC transporter ATP-binding protein [Spiroplasma cantharicola]
MSNNFFEVKNLSKVFKNKSGVNNVSFTLKKGDIVGFLGDNGSGKTTIIKLIFNEYIKNGGEILFEDNEIQKTKAFTKMAFFPDQNNYPKDFKIIDFAMYTANLKNISKKDVLENLSAYVKALNLEEYQNNKFSELSAGMQKRALLLSILITDPEIIILDEPTANLDIKSRLEFLKILSNLATKFKKTIVITSHNIDELSSLINRIVILKKVDNKGEIVYNQTFDNKKENIRDIYIEQVGGLTNNINFDKVIEIENKTNVIESKTKKVALNFAIAKRVFFELIKSKIFIIMSVILFTSTIFVELLFLYLLPPKNFDINSTLLAWMPFTMILIYISYFEIHFNVRFYNKEINNGVLNLEIRSGLSKTQIFWERFLINKLIIFSYILIMISILAIFIPTTQNFYSIKTLSNVLPGYFILFILDLLIFSIICLFVTINSSALIGVIGTIFALCSSMSLLIDASVTAFIFPSYTTWNKNENSNYLKLYNTRFLVGLEMQKIMNKYGEDSLIKQHLESLTNINKIFNFESNFFYLTEYNYLLNDSSYRKEINSRTYIRTLLINGLITESDNLRIYKDGSLINLEVSSEFKENKLINDLKEIKKLQPKEEKTNYNSTLFREYSKAEVIDKDLYKGSNGLYELIEKINSKTKNSELKDIANLIKKISKYAYDKYDFEKNPGYSILERPFDYYDYLRSGMWTYTKETRFNDQWNNQINISDGVRTFNKIYTDLLMSYIHLKNPIYGNSNDSYSDPEFDLYAKEYNQFARKNAYLNPFTTFVRILFESSYDKYFNSLYYSTEWVDTTYELVGYNENESNKWENIKSFDYIRKVGKTFSPVAGSFMYLLLSLILLAFSYLIFIKKIIK